VTYKYINGNVMDIDDVWWWSSRVICHWGANLQVR